MSYVFEFALVDHELLARVALAITWEGTFALSGAQEQTVLPRILQHCLHRHGLVQEYVVLQRVEEEGEAVSEGKKDHCGAKDKVEEWRRGVLTLFDVLDRG